MSRTQFESRLAPLEKKPAGKLLVHEIYHSIQGESSYAGLPCVFVRMSVCDARCVWCDTPHAFANGSVLSPEEIAEQVQGFQCSLAEITGGEPLLQPEVFPLMSMLAELGIKVLLETSGAHDVSPADPRVHIIMDLKCPDSGECANNLWANLEILKPTDEIKFVISSRPDFDWAVEATRKHGLDRRFTVLFSPVFGSIQLDQLAKWLLESRLQVRLQLQLHKFIWDPSARGV